MALDNYERKHPFDSGLTDVVRCIESYEKEFAP